MKIYLQWKVRGTLFNGCSMIQELETLKRFNLTKGGYVVAQLTGITREVL